jgi:protein required for attachment to host cells
MSNEESSHQHGCKRFAAEIDAFLKQGRMQNAYDELVLFAEPKFLGMLLGEMDQPTKNFLINQVRKDIVQLADHQIVQNIREVG